MEQILNFGFFFTNCCSTNKDRSYIVTAHTTCMYSLQLLVKRVQLMTTATLPIALADFNSPFASIQRALVSWKTGDFVLAWFLNVTEQILKLCGYNGSPDSLLPLCSLIHVYMHLSYSK